MEYRFLTRRDTMLIAAIDLLDRGGIQGLTTKEIAKMEGVTEAAVYKHYTGKQAIVAAILERFASFDEQICNTIVEKRMTEEEGLRFYATTYAENYQWYPQIATLLFSFDVYRYTPELKEIMKFTMEGRKIFLERFILNSRLSEGTSDKILSPDVLANIVLGTISSSVYFWKMNDENFDLKDMVLKHMDSLLRANRGVND